MIGFLYKKRVTPYKKKKKFFLLKKKFFVFKLKKNLKKKKAYYFILTGVSKLSHNHCTWRSTVCYNYHIFKLINNYLCILVFSCYLNHIVPYVLPLVT